MVYAVVTVFTKDGSLFSETMVFQDNREMTSFEQLLDHSKDVDNWIITPIDILGSFSPVKAREFLKKGYGVNLDPRGMKEWRPE